MSADPDLMKKLVSLSRKGDNKAFEDLLVQIEPTVKYIATNITPRRVEDSMQAARLKVWRNLKHVRLGKSSTIFAYLIRVAKNAILDEYNKAKNPEKQVEELENTAAGKNQQVNPEFNEFMQHYLDYVRENGKFAGAHRGVANKLGLSVARVSYLFNLNSAEFIERSKSDVNLRFSQVIERIRSKGRRKRVGLEKPSGADTLRDREGVRKPRPLPRRVRRSRWCVSEVRRVEGSRSDRRSNPRVHRVPSRPKKERLSRDRVHRTRDRRSLGLASHVGTRRPRRRGERKLQRNK